MEQYDFSYELPYDFRDCVIRFCQLNKFPDIAQRLQSCTLDYDDVGFAYYAGLQGETWNKKALDFTIEGSENDITLLKMKLKDLKSIIQKLLHPSKTGFLLRKIDFIITDSELKIALPSEEGETFETLSRDIYDALGKNEPTLVLDRLHIYSTKFLREICQKHKIGIADSSGNHYALHSLVGSLAKYYKANKMFKSNFSELTLKTTISIFEKYNDIRNNKSYAHYNDVLDKAEATYVVSIVTATLTFINSIEENNSEDWESFF